LTEREILRNLVGIVRDADELPVRSMASSAIGVLSTEQRKTWAQFRTTLQADHTNAACLQIVDNALFVVCLDDATPDSLAELCGNYLCGTYKLEEGVQVGTCTNRWYDKVEKSLARNYKILILFTVANYRLRRRFRWHQL
jgi:carnitine O-acetyltransferase